MLRNFVSNRSLAQGKHPINPPHNWVAFVNKYRRCLEANEVEATQDRDENEFSLPFESFNAEEEKKITSPSGTVHVFSHLDCFDVPAEIGKIFEQDSLGQVSLVVMDPPYGLEKAEWDTKRNASRFIKNLQCLLKELAELPDSMMATYWKFVYFGHLDSADFRVCS